MAPFDIVLIANSPGELTALASPMAKKFKKLLEAGRIILILPPCQYSSGNEVDFAQKNIPADLILSKEEYKKWILGAPVKDNFAFSEKGVVLFLGGDLLHAVLTAKKLKYKAYAYLAGKHVSWISSFEKFFVPDKEIFAGKIPEEKLIECGDLMSEPLFTISKEAAREKWHIAPEKKVIAMMPGSRLWEINHLLPIYEKIGEKIKKEDSNINLMLIISPFTSMKDIEKIKEHHIFDVFAYFDSITAADLVITIPGTNTAQIAAIPLPMLVLFPLDRPEVIPLEGIAHYITSIPYLGIAIKRFIAKIIDKKTKYFALPNIKADQEIVPEIRGKIDSKEVSDKILKMVKNEDYLKKTADFLRFVMKNRKASDKIAETILNENPFSAS